MPHSVLPPTTLVQIMIMIAKLEDFQFDRIKAQILGPRSYEVSNAQREKLSFEIDIPDESLGYLFSGLSFLYRQLKPMPGETQAELNAKIERVLSDLRVPEKDVDKSLLARRLSQLLAYGRNHQLHMKVARLEEGFIASVVGVSSFVDLRPSFTDDRTEIDGFVPIVQLMISTDSPRSHETQVVFQLDLESLETLKSAIDDVDRKLNVLRGKKDFFLPLLTLDDEQS